MSNEINTSSLPDKVSDKKAWDMLEKVVTSSVTEQRRSRRWANFFKILTFLYLFTLLWLFKSGASMASGSKAVSVTKPHVAVVKVNGVIADSTDANAAVINTALRKAFDAENAKAILLSVNSPGGSPVQSGYVYDEIKRLRTKHPEKPVYAVVGDIGASGAYYIASAADEIYANRASLVGSIGVVSASFGYVEAMEKVGVTRRMFIAGKNKAMMDQFSPLNDAQIEHWQTILDSTHQQFIDAVKAGRGDRLQEAKYPDIFTGLVWNGDIAKEMGLVDGLGSPRYVAEEVIGEENIVDYTVQPDPLKRFAKRFGMGVAESVSDTMQYDFSAKMRF